MLKIILNNSIESRRCKSKLQKELLRLVNFERSVGELEPAGIPIHELDKITANYIELVQRNIPRLLVRRVISHKKT